MLADLPEDLLVQISCAFCLFDSDKDGYIKPKDFVKVLAQNQIKIPESSVRDILGPSNSYNNNEATTDVSLKEFVNIVNSRMKCVESEEELMEMFKIFDKKGTGKVSSGDIRAVLDDIDEPLSQQELEELMLNWDKDKDGFLDFAEFKEMMTNV